MGTERITAAAAGTWTLGDMTVNRMGFGAMRLTRNADGTPGDRGRAIAMLRRALELGVNHIDTAGSTSRRCALAWTLQLGPHVLAIPGTGNPDHLEANVAAGALRLTPGEMVLLSR